MRPVGIALLALVLGLASPSLAQEPPLDGTRPLDTPLVCLARTIYFEARGQSDQGMVAVGHVVMNRVKSPAYPDDLCAVVREGKEEGPCQFSWWCDDKPNAATDERAYHRAVHQAADILEGKAADPTKGANMFHNSAASPAWAKKAEPRGRIGDHFFYYLEGR
ncbi:MAG: cell wall hydrolase [Paracoccaceae bacterium]|nr:cell wall hydrolase [Paracoccaceae bacterium]